MPISDIVEGPPYIDNELWPEAAESIKNRHRRQLKFAAKTSHTVCWENRADELEVLFKTNSRREDDVRAFHIYTARHFFFDENLAAYEELDCERPETRSR